MIDFTIHTHIARPVADVFAYATDPDKLPTWQTNTVSSVLVDGGPLAVGARLCEVHRAPGGKQIATVVEVSEYEPDAAFGLRMLEGPMPLHARLTFEPDGEGTLLRFRSYGEVGGAARLLKPVLRRQFARHCRTLKQLLEQSCSPRPA